MLVKEISQRLSWQILIKASLAERMGLVPERA